MSVFSKRRRPHDPRVVRSRAAVVDAARALFLEHGYGGTTVDAIAAAAGLTKRTVYNNYPDKPALFRMIVADVTGYADAFVATLGDAFTAITPGTVDASLHDLGRRLALGIVRQEVVAVRRLLIGEAREFPEFARHYFDRAPGQVLAALVAGFRRLNRSGVLRVEDARVAAAQFAYLVAGAPLDRAVLTGEIPPEKEIVTGAREGVATFLARFSPGRRPRAH